MSKRIRNLTRAVLSLLILAGVAHWGCAPTAPIVANNTLEPWEEEYARAMMQPEALMPTPVPTPPGLIHTHPVSPDSEEDGSSHVVAELLGAPFRGIGWLLRTIF